MSKRPIHNGTVDAAVIGGGAIGLAVAWRAAQNGLRVVVLERGQLGGGTSAVAAGMLAPVTEADPKEQALLRLNLLSAATYPAFVEELKAASDFDPGYLPCGTLAVARDRDEAEALERERLMRDELGLAVRRLRPSDARGIEPSLAPTVRLALEVQDDHAIDPRRLTAALHRAAERAGAEMWTGSEVTDVLVHGNAVRGVALRDGSQLTASQVVLAAGVWCGQIGGIPVDARVTIHPVKGQILRLRDPYGPGLLGRILRMSGGYVVPRGDGRYVLGATMEERGFDTSVTVAGAFELLRDAIELLPSLSELVIEELSAGLRPATPDNAPAIGPGALEGLYWATGHFRNGILLAPITAEILAAQLAGDEPPELAADFSPVRFMNTEFTVRA